MTPPPSRKNDTPPSGGFFLTLLKELTEIIIFKMVRFRMALTMAARRSFANIHLTIVPTAHARLFAFCLARRPLSTLDRPSRETSVGFGDVVLNLLLRSSPVFETG